MFLYILGFSPQRLATMYGPLGQSFENVSLIIFARFPYPGKVKTRLASSLGPDLATDFYRLCAEHIFDESGKLCSRSQRYLFYADDADTDRIRNWVGPGFNFVAQIEGDLGRRMEHAFDTVSDGVAHKSIIVGTDVPDLSADIIDDAIHALDSCDIVIGPCHDGGYYLLGMKKLHREIFEDIPWSTDQVLSKTLNAIEELQLNVHLLPALSDIDIEEDLMLWSSSLTDDVQHPVQDFARRINLY
jgi:rSAM/selenodomain-associated transferase 1